MALDKVASQALGIVQRYRALAEDAKLIGTASRLREVEKKLNDEGAAAIHPAIARTRADIAAAEKLAEVAPGLRAVARLLGQCLEDLQTVAGQPSSWSAPVSA